MHTSWLHHKGAHVSNSTQDSLIVLGSIHCSKVMFSPAEKKKQKTKKLDIHQLQKAT